jgi:hypothetical protein
MATQTVSASTTETRRIIAPGIGRGALGTYNKGRKVMASSGKKKTTMAKLARERKLHERRLSKQAKKDARKQASADRPDSQDGALNATTTEAAPQPGPGQAALEPAVQPLVEVDFKPSDQGVARGIGLSSA